MTGFMRGAATALALTLLASTAFAAPGETFVDVPAGRIITPASSQPTTGSLAHTNIHIMVPGGKILKAASGPSGIYETPASLACVYRQVRQTAGCNPETLTTVTRGGSKVVVIVDAYDDPTAADDLATFSKQFNLPPVSAQNFRIVYAGGKVPAQDPTGDWELEESLDIEIVHSLAPNAKVVLVEAQSSQFADLFAAERIAARIAANAGGGEVTNSWGGQEMPDTPKLEATFTGANVVFFASAGDSPGVIQPSSLSNVIGVGGTQINRDASGNFLSQTIWSDTGGGYSLDVPIPSYQSAIAADVHYVRGVPDIALDASTTSGFWIYDSTMYEGQVLDWVPVGGTSAASPAAAAIVNSAKSFAASSVAELTKIYGELGDSAYFTDIRSGLCQNGDRLRGWKSWDPCTGIGTPFGRSGK
jgi:subtilase family serine protease